MRTFQAPRLVAAVLLASACARAPRTPPPQPADPTAATDVFLYRFAYLGRESGVFNITNRTGYDNQPFFEKNDRILYTAISAGQYDIRAIDLGEGVNSAITNTPESEYSAALTPDGQAITVVRVERDSSQRLWRFPRDGSAPSVILPNIKPVGYFAWLDSTTLALFVLGSPNTLQIADVATGTSRVVTTNIGRSIQRIPGGRKASYVHRVNGKFVLESVDPTPTAAGFDIDTLATLPDSAEFVVWRSRTEAYTAAGSSILRLQLPAGTWTLVEDLSARGIGTITRLALSPDGSRLALVVDEPKPER